MAIIESWFKSDLKKFVEIKKITGNFFSADNEGNLIGFEIFDNGEPATISGNVYGYIIRADNATVPVQGVLEGNRVSIVLPLSAYAVVGQISIVVKIGNTTVGACTGFVYRTTTDTIVDPGTIVPDLSVLLAKIGDCEDATDDANSAALAANTAAANVAVIIAPEFDKTVANDPKTYATNEGNLYYLPEGHTAYDEWEDTTKVQKSVSELLPTFTLISSNRYCVNL